MEKFNYQFIFEFGDDDRVVFFGTTSSKFVAKLSEIQEKIRKVIGKDDYKTISINFQPLENEQTKK